ncbi:MAG: DUF547 domain-containing protein, partial [Acidobacteria bacterium]|nr:DUF547 domain-containing protein [Acidobacteriota bacterium]
MRKWTLTLLLLLVVGLFSPAAAQEFDHSPWDRVLKQFVNDQGRVDYARLKANSKDLDAFVDQIKARSPASHPQAFTTRDSQLAYWINAYNALVMKAVIQEWPIKSVRDIGWVPYGFFWLKKFPAGGKKYTLNGIEDILRKQLREPRIHFALVCAANSCPYLQREAYTPENTERLLEAGTRYFVNEPRNLTVEADKNLVHVPRIFTYYKEDFEKYAAEKQLSAGHPAVTYIKLYANEANRRALEALPNPRVEAMPYDWGVNDLNAP